MAIKTRFGALRFGSTPGERIRIYSASSKEELNKIENLYQGDFGIVTFKSNGNVSFDTYFYNDNATDKNNKWVLVATTKPGFLDLNKPGQSGDEFVVANEDGALLTSLYVTTIFYQKSFYKLQLIRGNKYIYSADVLTSDGNYELWFLTFDTLNNTAIVQNKKDYGLAQHIENMEVHITQQERERWNNKVSATAEQITTDNYKLNLTTDLEEKR